MERRQLPPGRCVARARQVRCGGDPLAASQEHAAICRLLRILSPTQELRHTPVPPSPPLVGFAFYVKATAKSPRCRKLLDQQPISLATSSSARRGIAMPEPSRIIRPLDLGHPWPAGRIFRWRLAPSAVPPSIPEILMSKPKDGATWRSEADNCAGDCYPRIARLAGSELADCRVSTRRL